MSSHTAAILVLGMALFAVGALARTYMNILISRSTHSRSRTRSTERRYKQLVRDQGARLWPLIVTVTLIPLGILLAFAAVVLNNYATK